MNMRGGKTQCGKWLDSIVTAEVWTLVVMICVWFVWMIWYMKRKNYFVDTCSIATASRNGQKRITTVQSAGKQKIIYMLNNLYLLGRSSSTNMSNIRILILEKVSVRYRPSQDKQLFSVSNKSTSTYHLVYHGQD